MLKKWILAGSIFLITHGVRAASVSEVVPSLINSRQYEEAYRVLTSQLEKESEPGQKAADLFALGVIAHQMNWNDKAQAHLAESLKIGSHLDDYAHFLLAESYRRTGKFKEARTHYLKSEEYKPRVDKLYYDAEFALGELALAEKNTKLALSHFTYLEKRLRRDEKYPEIIWNLLKIELEKQRKWAACKWATKLYSKYPAHILVHHWGIDLQKATVEGKPLGCLASLNDHKTRIRNLQLQGLLDQARKEIEQLQSRTSTMTKFHTDTLMATFLSAEGRVSEALNLLLPYYKREGGNFNFLMQLASTAARAGEFQMAVGAYHKAHNLKRNSKLGRTALFQAAFLSYQFQDYDGAGRKFEQFIKKYPKSGLSKDAEWHLAWIRYLKGDYEGAYKGFAKTMVKKTRRGKRQMPSDKAQYWMAMSLLKMDRKAEAVSLFQTLSQDKGMGYYAIAAMARLTGLKDLVADRKIAQENKENKENKDVKEKPAETVATLSQEAQALSENEENESEDDESTFGPQAGEGETEGDDEEAAGTDGAEIVSEVEIPVIHAPHVARHFKRAQDLASFGFKQWATWELFSLERRTSNPGNLRSLIQRYEASEAFHRSSYIAQIYFSRQRAQGIKGNGRPFWQSAYPRAFERSVTTFSKAFSVPEEFVWGIMRAESHFKPDVKSPVGALGLMQVMPFTGRKLASILDIPSFEPLQLLDPAVNIRLGTRYLQRLLKIFDQKIPLAAAAYNAGPHRVKSWIKSFGKLDMDEFVEHIPFLETRNYVKRVVHNYNTYKLLYGKNAKEEPLPWLAGPVGINIEGQVELKEDWDSI